MKRKLLSLLLTVVILAIPFGSTAYAEDFEIPEYLEYTIYNEDGSIAEEGIIQNSSESGILPAASANFATINLRANQTATLRANVPRNRSLSYFYLANDTYRHTLTLQQSNGIILRSLTNGGLYVYRGEFGARPSVDGLISIHIHNLSTQTLTISNFTLSW